MSALWGNQTGFLCLKNSRACKRKADAERLWPAIEQIYYESRCTDGSPRIHKALKNSGMRIGRKRVERLVRDRGGSMPGVSGRIIAAKKVKRNIITAFPTAAWALRLPDLIRYG